MNSPLLEFDPNTGYRFENLELGEKNTDELIVALTFSGGGTRAAAFSYGVLEQLRDTYIGSGENRRRLLDEVDVISSVSGGSLTAAAYGLRGDEVFDDFLHKALYTDIQGTLVKQVFSPKNLSKFASPYYGRSDMLADNFEEYLQGATFADLLQKRRRPFIMINSTDVSLGLQFTFTQFFFDFLYSDLSNYPLSRAVAASAAVPGLLTALTLNNFPKEPDYIQPEWIQNELQNGTLGTWRNRSAADYDSYGSPDRRYIHLVDGGLTDNLGLLPLIQVVAGLPSAMSTESSLIKRGTKKVVIITVNSKKRTENDWGLKEDIVGILKMFQVVTGAPMGDFSDAQIAYMRLLIEKRDAERQQLELIKSIEDEHNIHVGVPEAPSSRIEYKFVELSFAQMASAEEREYLLALPTSFRLSKEQVDRLRAAAKTIMDSNAEYQEILASLE